MEDNYMYGNFNQPEGEATVTLSLSAYEELQDDSKFLDALRSAGVDNWDGYDFALEIYDTFD